MLLYNHNNESSIYTREVVFTTGNIFYRKMGLTNISGITLPSHTCCFTRFTIYNSTLCLYLTTILYFPDSYVDLR